jgi:FixJ family two-component response regulator
MTRADAATAARQARTEARRERIALVAAMRLHPGPDWRLDGYVTSRQAAERLGVCQRTVERYRAECRRAGMLP